MIVIIGSGIIGLFTAFKLLEIGKKVKLIDSIGVGGRATNASVGMLAPLIEAKPYEQELFGLMLDSKKIWDKFLQNEDFTNKTKLKKNSSLLVAHNQDDEERIIFKKDFFEKLGFETQILDTKYTLKIEPNLNSNINCSLLCEKHNQVEPMFLKKYLLKQIIDLGGEFEEFTNLEKFSYSKGKLKIQNHSFEAEKIIIACGVWSSDLLKESLGISFPTRPIKGVSMLFKTDKKLFSNNIWFRNIYIAPRHSNFLAVGATEDEKGFDDSVTLDEIYFITKSLWEHLPEIEKLKFQSISSGIRSGVIDGNPIIGNLKNNKDIICAFGHFRHGILLAPITAEILCNYVSESSLEKKFNFFSPKRFNL